MLALNVALKKNAKDCKNRNLVNAILDGNKDPQMSTDIENQCEGQNSFVEVMLLGGYVIHYVVVYAGESEMNYFGSNIKLK